MKMILVTVNVVKKRFQNLRGKQKRTLYLIISKYFMSFCFCMRNDSPKVSNIQRREVELNIIWPRVKNFDIKQKMALNIWLTIYPQHQTMSKWVNAP